MQLNRRSSPIFLALTAVFIVGEAAAAGAATLAAPALNPATAAKTLSLSGHGYVEVASLRAMTAMPGGIPGFVALWTVMMAAMMLPSVTPAVLLFATVARSRTQFGFAVAPTAVFVAGYLAVWTLAGVAVALADRMSGGAVTTNAWGRAFAGAALVIGGVYQLTRWKMWYLSFCREPLQFFMAHWRDGLAGALGMGAQHGLYCLGCCWGLTLALIALGLMNPLWMAASALIIFEEKVAPWGERLVRPTGASLILAGIGIIVGWDSVLKSVGGLGGGWARAELTRKGFATKL